MLYYEARYLKPPTFISRDVYFERYFWTSSYTYCLNNPLKYVDPDGKDIYRVDENGNSVGKPIKNKNFDQIQVVRVTTDENGKNQTTVLNSSKEYKYGTIIGRATNIPGKDDKGNPVKMDFYAIKGSKEGKEIHQFLSDNTIATKKVEYSRWDFKSDAFGELNVIGTSHQEYKDASGKYVKSFLDKNNWFGYLQTQDHNHPGGTHTPSEGDIGFIKSIERANPNVDFRIYPKGLGGYLHYNSSGPTGYGK